MAQINSLYRFCESYFSGMSAVAHFPKFRNLSQRKGLEIKFAVSLPFLIFFFFFFNDSTSLSSLPAIVLFRPFYKSILDTQSCLYVKYLIYQGVKQFISQILGVRQRTGWTPRAGMWKAPSALRGSKGCCGQVPITDCQWLSIPAAATFPAQPRASLRKPIMFHCVEILCCHKYPHRGLWQAPHTCPSL